MSVKEKMRYGCQLQDYIFTLHDDRVHNFYHADMVSTCIQIARLNVKALREDPSRPNWESFEFHDRKEFLRYPVHVMAPVSPDLFLLVSNLEK